MRTIGAIGNRDVLAWARWSKKRGINHSCGVAGFDRTVGAYKSRHSSGSLPSRHTPLHILECTYLLSMVSPSQPHKCKFHEGDSVKVNPVMRTFLQRTNKIGLLTECLVGKGLIGGQRARAHRRWLG